ncbi:MAG: hypothetical protein ACI85O_000872 [Saprospiraceae bacterium]|jgi:hypothetical protein
MTSKFLKLFTLLIFASALLVSCNKDEDVQPLTQTPVTETPEETATTPSTDNSGQINAMVAATETEGCYEIAFPITFVYEDGTTVTADTEADLEDIFSEDAENFPWEIGFPVSLEDPETGETVTAANEEELFAYFMECEGFDDGEWDDEDGPWDDENPCDSIDFGFGTFGCYDLVFPVSFVLEDGSIVTAEDEDALGDIFLNNGPADFSYPINLEDEDDVAYVANNEEELFALLEDCDDFDGGGNGGGGEWDETVVLPLTFMSINGGEPGAPQNCYSYVYPVTVTNDDGETTTANNDEEMLNAAFSSNGSINFVYPVSVTDNETGETLTANDEDEAWELIEACGDFDGGGNGGGGEWEETVVFPLTFMSINGGEPGVPQNCYSYIFPVSVTNDDGEITTANTEEELLNAIFGNDQSIDFVYPVSVTDNETGETLTANDDDEAWELVEACEG